MSDEAKIATWTTYSKAWSEVSPAERHELLQQSVADDCVYSDPSAQCHGRAELLAYIEQFFQNVPGASFRNHRTRVHHAQSLTDWTLHDAQGAEIQPGTSYGLYGADGRLTNLAGFFEAAPSAD